MREYWLVILMGAVGLGILGYGLWQVVAPEKVTVEITGAQSSEHSLAQGSELKVDVAGAVTKPGVYTLPQGARVGDALVAAGGLAAAADREWVAATLNLASLVTDGEKIYIPARQQVSESADQQASEPMSQKSVKININTASTSELDTLWGVGQARAAAVIAGRPYANTAELVSKGGVPQNVYDKIKDQIAVY